MLFDRAAPEELVGLVSLDTLGMRPHAVAMLSCSLDGRYEGRGYAREGVEAVIDYARDLGQQAIVVHYDPENARSAALWQALGFEVQASILDVPPPLRALLRPQVMAARRLE